MRTSFFLFALTFSLNSDASFLRFACEYPIYSSEDAHGQESYDRFKLEFTLDQNTEQAFLVGNNGMSEVQFIPNDKGWTFLEITGSGNVTTTTITRQLKSVHSRNTILTNLVASQYYGDCERL